MLSFNNSKKMFVIFSVSFCSYFLISCQSEKDSTTFQPTSQSTAQLPGHHNSTLTTFQNIAFENATEFIKLRGDVGENQDSEFSEDQNSPSFRHRKLEFKRELGAHPNRDEQALLSNLSLPLEENLSRDYDVLSYSIEARVDWHKSIFHASETVAIRLLRPVDVQKVVVLDAAVASIQMVRDNEGRKLLFVYDAKAETLKIDLGSLNKNSPDKKRNSVTLQIDYQVNEYQSRSALFKYGNREGDPNKAEALFTVSEPQGSRAWFPCHDTPSDRATFKLRMHMPTEKSLVANGILLEDRFQPGEHIMTYGTAVALPTYLMAFAVGDFISFRGRSGELPVAIWARKGSNLNLEGLLDLTIKQIKYNEKLLGSFPFEKYEVVLLPDFPGGIEYAGITFVSEIQASEANFLGTQELLAHELGHQWFGDQMTIQNWNDLWIKEGMATLLSAEYQRTILPKKDQDQFLGQEFGWVREGEAVIDSDLTPENKYNSGPYTRAAWVFTQLRSTVGDKVFWAVLRKVLVEFKFLSISTDQFLNYWEKYLTENQKTRFRAALYAKSLPRLKVEQLKGDSDFRIELMDKEKILIAPIELSLTTSKRTSHYTLANENSLIIKRTQNSLVLYDPRGAQLPIGLFVDKKDKLSMDSLASLLKIDSDFERENFILAPLSSQKTALKYANWNLSPSHFDKLVQETNYGPLKFLELALGCRLAGEKLKNTDWLKSLASVFRKFKYSDLRSYGGLDSCSADLADEVILPVLKFHEMNNGLGTLDLSELARLKLLVLSSDSELKYWSQILRIADTSQKQSLAFEAIESGFKKYKEKLGRDPVSRNAWLDLFRKFVENVSGYGVFNTALATLASVHDTRIFSFLPGSISALPRIQWPEIICTSYSALNPKSHDDFETWKSFIDSMKRYPNLSPEIQAVFRDPKLCETQDRSH